MKKTKIMQNKGRKISFLLVIALLFLVSVNLSAALTINSIPNYSVEETKTISFNITLSNYNGTTNMVVSPYGSITKVSNSLITYSWTPSLGQIGNYTITFTATDDLNTTTAQNRISVVKLNNPPIITSITAGAQTIPQVTITVTTDRACTCKYSTVRESYSQMPYTFAPQNEEKTEHQGQTPSLAQGLHTIYASCIDEEGNYMVSPSQISLNINLRPSASISLDPDAPLKAGTISIELTTSEALIGTPDLKYSFDDDSTLRTVALIGSGTNWQGYLIIKDTDSERIGSFTFRGYDLTNLEGTDITSGKLFLVDTEIPSALQSLSIENLDDRIKISWEEPDSESVKEYKIYRREASGGVETVDYYESTDELFFTDKDVEYNQAYYYRVALVDKAGNEGPLSKEVFITHIPVIEVPTYTAPEPVVEEKLDSKLEYILNDKIHSVEETEMDISKAKETLSRLLGTDNIDTIETLGVLEKLSENENKVTELKNYLESLRTQDLSENEFNSRVAEIMAQITNAWESTPLEVRVIDSATYQEFTNDEKTTTLVSDYLGEYYKELSSRDITSSVETAKTLQDLVIVDVKLLKGEVKYPNEKKPFVIVKKTLTSGDVEGKAVLFESIPSSVGSPQEITFTEQPFYRDSYVFWNIDGLTSKKLSYFIYSDVNLADLKGVKSIVFVEQPLIDKQKETQSQLEDSGNSITGGVTGNTDNGENNVLLVLIVAGVMVVCGLFAYYVFWSEEEGKEHKETKSKKIAEPTHSDSSGTNQDAPHRFSVAKALFKMRRESILPNDNHRRIIIDKPDHEILHGHDNYDIHRFDNHAEQEKAQEEEQEITSNTSSEETHNQNIQSDFKQTSDELQTSNAVSDIASSSEQIKNHKPVMHLHNHFADLDEVETRLKDLKNSKIEDIDDFEELRTKTYQIKNLCEEIEEKSIIEFTNKTKANLEKSLLYIAKYAPPIRGTPTKQEEEVKKEQIMHNVQEIKNKLPHVHKEHIAPAGKEFFFSNGSKAKNIAELKEQIAHMSEETYNHHVTSGKNDFATWIGEILGEYDLAYLVRIAPSKDALLKILSEHRE